MVPFESHPSSQLMTKCDNPDRLPTCCLHWRHGASVQLPIGGAGSSKVVVSCTRSIKLSKSHFLYNVDPEWAGRSSKMLPDYLQSFHFGLFFGHFEGARSRRMLKELAGHLRASTANKHDAIMRHHLATLAEKVSSDGSATSLSSRPLVDSHMPVHLIHFGLYDD